MKRPAVLIIIGYLLITVIFFLVAGAVSSNLAVNDASGIRKAFLSFERIFFWIEMYLFYGIFLLASSIMGMYWAKRYSYLQSFKVFKIVFIMVVISVVATFAVSLLTE
ncbi:MAG: hypothetical protein HKN67_04560 [Saprospiraceae bacterium]|nr:hypothetical protein [Bacteroidia bacterium]NNF21191.1 hypothetical protein [Saprospiraceae bacterium]NNK89242.1 hypothetical protein [Saprospiraceae bacterium]